MARFVVRLLGALALTAIWTSASVAAQPQPPATLAVSISGLQAGTQVEVTVELSGAGAPTTGTAGGDMLDMLANVGVGGKPHVEVTVHIGDQCVDSRVHIALTRSGTDPKTIPPACKRRTAGVFWLDRAQHITVSIANGTIAIDESPDLNASTSSHKRGKGKTVIIVVAGSAAAIGGGLAARGGGSTPASATPPASTATTTPPASPTTPPTTTPPSTPTPPAQPAPTANNFAGPYNGSGTLTMDGCGGFSSSTNIAARITVTDNGTATITWTKQHTNAGVTFVFPNVRLNIRSATEASFTASGPHQVGSATYTVTEAADISGVTLTLTQTFTRMGTPCTSVYRMTLTKG